MLKELHDVRAVISPNSSPGVVSAIEGVSYLLDPKEAWAKDVANINLRNIEKPNYDFDREGWLRRLAMSLLEIR